LRIGWISFPTICTGRSGCQFFSRRRIFGTTSVVLVPTIDHISLDFHEVKEAKARRIVLDGVKDHLLPRLVEKPIAKEMWDVLDHVVTDANGLID
jgi:hypothetical protein